MVMAVVILLLPVVLIYWWFSRIPEPQVTAVDWQPVVAAAKAESPYAIAVPASVPAGWTVVRARWTKVGQPGLNQQPAVGNTLQLGYLTTDRMYLGLDQRDTDSRGLIREVSKDAVSDGESVIADVPWQRYVSPDGRTRLLVRTGDASTVVVSGDVAYSELETFAASLRDQ